MNAFVKKFVETNIEDIENRNWEHLLRAWYKAIKTSATYEACWWEELLAVMLIVDSDAIRDSEKARETIIREDLIDIFRDVAPSVIFSRNKEIPKWMITDRLADTLGLNTEQVIGIADKLCKSFSLTPEFETYSAR